MGCICITREDIGVGVPRAYGAWLAEDWAKGCPVHGRGPQQVDAPFPWFGGKRRVADVVWQRFGDVPNYVEPFFGSGAVLLNRPSTHRNSKETVNDKDGYLSNFWRAVQHDSEQTAFHADNPVNENGFGSQGDEESRGKSNRSLERIWFSPHCLKASKQGVLL